MAARRHRNPSKSDPAAAPAPSRRPFQAAVAVYVAWLALLVFMAVRQHLG
ncbi:MAG TPA: hypothetical protein PLP01_11385 [Phycisphaerae bacterium]|nr:hypothetical protein [Phycisphaerae bacterium]HOI55843.1 hypothetical protein [Phycisphaerae bacterium]